MPVAWERLGGRALTSTIVAAEVPPVAHPLGSGNRLVLAPGLLAGTCAACSGRLSIGAKSPLTGAIKEGNAGFMAGRLLAGLGIGAVVIEGVPEGLGWYRLVIDRCGVSVQPERRLVGLRLPDLAAALDRGCRRPLGMVGIGPAGEMEMPAANLALRDGPGREGRLRALGRGGLGAVLGSKRIKLITFDDNGVPAPALADEAGFAAAFARFTASLDLGARCPLRGGRPPSRRAVSTQRIADPVHRAEIQQLVDDLGLDSIETGVMFELAMEAGLVGRGDGPGVIGLLTDHIAKGTALGRVLGGGTVALRRIYGLSGTPVVKEPLLPVRPGRPVPPPLSVAVDGATLAIAIMDSLGMCAFMGVPALDLPERRRALCDMVAARWGWPLADGDLDGIGRRVLAAERSFAAAAGCPEPEATPQPRESIDRAAALNPYAAQGGIWDF
jgi:aldehyde:ferredoxin oxidoreductase